MKSAFRLIVSYFHKLFFGVEPQKEFLESLLILSLLLGIGTVFYSQTEHWSLLDSLYFSVTTMATVGFGDLHPTTPGSKIFTIFYIFIGVGLGVFILSTIAKNLIQGREKRMKHLEELVKQLRKE